MNDGQRKHLPRLEKAGVALGWVVCGLYLVFGHGSLGAIKTGVPSRRDVGLWWDYLAVAGGLAMVITGACYYFVPRLKAYLDWEAEQVDLKKGKYRWFGWYTLYRFWRR